MTAYGYCRVSSERQAESGLGLEAQAVRIRDYVARVLPSEALVLRQEPGVSASRTRFTRRPVAGEIDAVAVRGDHIVIAKLDRGFRNLRDCATMLERWDRRGITVHLLDVGAATNSPAGRLLVGILATIAEWESRRIGERIRDAQQACRARGYWPSGVPPLGYRIRRNKLVPDPTMRRVIGLIWRLHRTRRQGRQVSCPIIAEWLTEHRYPGSPWTAKRVWRATHAPGAAAWARAVKIPVTWNPTVANKRMVTGDPKRAARMKVSPAKRRYIAHLGAEARRGKR